MFEARERGRVGSQSISHLCRELQVVLLCLAATSGFFIGASRAAWADDQTTFFAGGQADFANYVYMGGTVALPGSSIGNGFALRGLVTTGGYDYINSGLGTIRANFGGGELDGVYQLTLKSFWTDLSVGVNDTYTNLTPYDPTNPLRGQQAELRVSSDGGKTAGPWRGDWFGYYGPRLQDYEARIDGTHAVSSAWRLGVEAYAEGNPTYHLHQVGPFAGVNLGEKTELQFSAGQAWESGFTPRAYLRAFIYQRF